MSSENQDIEARIKEANQKRDRLATLRAEKAALLKSSQEKLEKLRANAEAKGIDIDKIPETIAEKKAALDSKVKEYELLLERVEVELTKYED